ncbi:c-type cytochrome [Spirosoma sp. HMF3257]|uniref:Cytochrome C n=1 Tax=Spirosoma telluris TaxID=2183553 RepID=A0A327NFZ8_9BACT|nr:c-type cytochrome [Spirosoma telluris]RAI74192.1 cytochrome C [Spirosoma telluris]
MKKVVKVIGILVGVVVLGVVGVMAYVKLALPDVGEAPELKVDATPARIERGRYLANHVTVCVDCHSTRDYSLFAAPPIPGTLGKGGELFDQKAGFPGSFTAKNITPAGIGNWTDGEIYRAITTGVSRDGHAFFPVMPYPYYGSMNDEDVHSIIAYVRTLKPIEHKPAESKADFPFNFILNTIPKKAEPLPAPDPNDELATGKYLVTIAGCVECHTQVEKGQIIREKSFAGGRDFNLPGGVLYTPNITPDKATGIGTWKKEVFVSRFKAYADSSYKPHKIGPNDFQTIMPWTMYAGMNEKDLGAIYTYLMSLKPIPNKVAEKFKPHVAMR